MHNDHQDKLLELAGEIANNILNGDPVKYGHEDHESYSMRDVQEYLLMQDDLCERFDSIHISFMRAVEDADAAVHCQIAMDELTLDAIGRFAESVVSRVYNYRVVDWY